MKSHWILTRVVPLESSRRALSIGVSRVKFWLQQMFLYFREPNKVRKMVNMALENGQKRTMVALPGICHDMRWKALCLAQLVM